MSHTWGFVPFGNSCQYHSDVAPHPNEELLCHIRGLSRPKTPHLKEDLGFCTVREFMPVPLGGGSSPE